MAEPTPETGAINIDQAAGILSAARAEPIAAPEPVAQPEPAAEVEDEDQPEGEPTPEEAPEPEEVTGDAEPEAEEPEQSVIRPPSSWDANGQEVWKTLDRKAQEVILARESERDKTVQRSMQEAVDAKKLAESRAIEAQSVTQIKAALDQIIPVAQQVFQSKWSDWTPQRQAEMARADPAGYVARDAEFKAEVAEMNRLNAVNRQTQAAAHQQFVQAEAVKLAEMVPELFEAKEGPARRQALRDYMVKENVPVDQIDLLDANTLRLARKAQLWDESQAKARSAAQPARTPAPAAAPVRPAAAQPAPSRTRSVDTARAHLNQTGSIDDGVALMRAKRGR